MNDLQFLQEIYSYDPEKHQFTIPISIRCYDEFFSRLDPSPAPKRDLSPELVEYLDQCSGEIPSRFDISIDLNISQEACNPVQERDCLGSLQRFFQHQIYMEKSEIRRQRLDALKYLLVSLLCLSTDIASVGLLSNTLLGNLIHQALQIGGWVFMWEAITVNFLQTDQHYQAIRKLKRFIQARIHFTYSGDKTIYTDSITTD
ncbi:MAG: hypothetical protein ABSA01_12995 [Anaerolineales bacterium]|jgi:hypothetical protein